MCKAWHMASYAILISQVAPCSSCKACACMLFVWGHMLWSKGIVCLLLSFHDSSIWLLIHRPFSVIAFLLLGSTKAGPFESLQTSSLGTSEELPSHYAMKTLEEQGALSVQQLIIGTYVSHAFIIWLVLLVPWNCLLTYVNTSKPWTEHTGACVLTRNPSYTRISGCYMCRI